MPSSKQLLGCVLLLASCSAALGALSLLDADFSFWTGDVAKNIALKTEGSLNPYRAANQLINNFVLSLFGLSDVSSWLLTKFGHENGYYAQCYLRDLVAGTCIYWITAGVWHFMIYNVMANKLFTSQGRSLPTWDTFLDQMCLAQASLFMYAGLPVLSEYLIENNMTKVYFYIDEIGGWPYYFAYLGLYLLFVEVGIYWVHRTLHENKFLYKYIHGLHHKYNKALTLTPWASIAFNPIDGLLQASPYVIGLFVLPVHYFTHVGLLFFSGVWATNIHDAVWADFEPIMGAKYHTVHHTHYHYNFGQFFIFADWFFGTLRVPDKAKFA